MAGKKLDLLIVNASSRRTVYQALGSTLAAVEPPVWARLLASHCLHRGYSVVILDAEAEELEADAVAEQVRSFNPVLTAVIVFGHQPSASTQNMTAAGEVVRSIKDKNPNQTVIMVGGHIAALPERSLREEVTDFVATGEGFSTLPALIDALNSSIPNFAAVPGLGYVEAETFRLNPEVPLLDDLNLEVPGDLGWNLLPMNRYRAHNWHCMDGSPRQPYASIYTTLGCPYRCSFCCIQAPFRQGERASQFRKSTNSYRYWQPEHVLAQIDYMVNHFGIRNIKIADEMFVLNRKHVLEICSGIIRRKYDLNLWAYARVDTIKEGMLGPMRDAGFTWLALGIEAGSQRVRADVEKAFQQDQVFHAVQQIRSAGINTIGNYIFGLPEDNIESMESTFDLATELHCEFANFYSTMAYPGSPLYQQAVAQGLPLPERWTGYAQHSKDCMPLPTRYLTASEVLRFRDQAFQRYYTNPHYLEMMERRFGHATVHGLRAMTTIPLERELLRSTSGPNVVMPPKHPRSLARHG